MDPGSTGACELCDAAELTERYHVDDLCWIAECESCSVPMVVWRVHHPDPPPEVRHELLDRLRAVVAAGFVDEIWIDEQMRTIPDHYHAHARRRRGFPNQPLQRRGRHVDASAPTPEETR